MHIRSIFAIARKDALDLVLNKSTLFQLLTPLFLAVFFVFIGDLLGGKTTNILIYNPGKSGVEQVVHGAFSDANITYANSSDVVTSEFGTNDTHKSSTYALGLIVPIDFDNSLHTGGHPQLQLYVNGDDVSNQERQLLQSAITDYSRSVASPQPPASITVATINPPQPQGNELQNIGQLYTIGALLSSLYIGTALVPGLMAEEKEKKTLRMLMVTPASFGDVVMGKLLVGFFYQLLLAMVVLAIKGGFIGEVPLVILFALLGSCFSVALGLLAGTIFQTTGSAGAFAGTMSFIYIIPFFFVGALGQLFQAGFVLTLVKILPTYYIADGAINALENRASFSNTLLDVAVVVGSILVLIIAATWGLRRQAAVAATI